MAKVIKLKGAGKQARARNVARFRGGLIQKSVILKRGKSIVFRKRKPIKAPTFEKKKSMVFDDYFQSDTEDAQRQQVEWAKDHLSIDTGFFVNFLKVDKVKFSEWMAKHESLQTEQREHLAELWRTILHLMSFMNSDTSRVKLLLQHKVLPEKHSAIRLPKWTGTSILSFLEREGPPATRVVDEYVTAFRFGDLYASSQ